MTLFIEIIIVLVAIGCFFGAFISVMVLIDLIRSGPNAIKLERHIQDHNCQCPNFCRESNTCVMLCHEKNRMSVADQNKFMKKLQGKSNDNKP